MSQTAVPSEPTEIAGRYQIVKKLGAGAFGTVFKAKDRLLGRMVAIKTIRLDSLVASGASADEMLDRFKREAMVSAQLKHPNIVTIYDIGDTDGSSYLAMEFIDGVGLEKVIAAGPLAVERAALIAAQVADALDFAHRNHVVHRDIKPANIMLEAGDRVKVTDFGIAKVTDSGDHLTMTGSLLGTPSYMSPEQARGAALDGRSDLFAVGCVLYEMLSGKKAFRGESITGLIFKIITEEPQPIRELDPAVPEEMVRVIARALAKHADARYQNGRELYNDLQAFLRAGATPTLRQSEVATAPPTPAGSTMMGRTLGGPSQTQLTGVPGASPTYAAPSPTLQPTSPRIVDSTAVAPPMHTAGGGYAPPAGYGTQPGYAPSPGYATQPGQAPSPGYGTHPGHMTSPGYGPPPSYAPPTAYAPQPTYAPPATAAAAPRKSNAGLIIGLAAGVLLLLVVGGGAAFYFLRKPSPPAVAESAAPGGTPVGSTPTATQPPAGGGEVAPFGQTAPPGSVPSATVPSSLAAAPPPAKGALPATSGAATTPAAEPPPAAPPPAPRVVAGDSGGGFLDQMPPNLDGRAAGERVAGTYRSGGATSGFGASRPLRARERFPSQSTPAERRGVSVLLNLMHLQGVYHRQNGRYGTFAQTLPMAVANPRSLQRNGYRFDLTVESDGYRIVATPLAMGLRALVGDESGFVRFDE